MKGHRARIILEKDQKQLLNERVRQVHFTIEDFGILLEGLNLAITPQHLPIVDLITATESATSKNNLMERLKVIMALSNAKAPHSNLTIQERKAVIIEQGPKPSYQLIKEDAQWS